MDKHEIRNRIEYIVVCVSEFAKRFKLTNQQAYSYLRRFTGIDFLINHYEKHLPKSTTRNVVCTIRDRCMFSPF